MKHKKQRYIQPTSAEDAMQIIQKLFNSYRNAPLTKELLDYHNNLVARLKDDIHTAAEQENNPKLVATLDQMIEIMQRWDAIRLSGRPFNAKMRHFKLVTEGGPKFKRRVHKINQSGSHRASRH